jgi:cation diffusion facilitator CzcD-associated flavoprotein CzcO
VDLLETPIERITPAGIRTTKREYEFDIIVYATGFDAVTGAYDRIDIRGARDLRLRDKWRDGPQTFYGLMVSGFPNMIMPTGPQSGSASSNFPRGIEMGVDWAIRLISYLREHGYRTADATPEAEAEWTGRVARSFERFLLRSTKGWFTGYNSNVDGHAAGPARHLIFTGSAARYREKITGIADEGYPGVRLS